MILRLIASERLFHQSLMNMVGVCDKSTSLLYITRRLCNCNNHNIMSFKVFLLISNYISVLVKVLITKSGSNNHNVFFYCSSIVLLIKIFITWLFNESILKNNSSTLHNLTKCQSSFRKNKLLVYGYKSGAPCHRMGWFYNIW